MRCQRLVGDEMRAWKRAAVAVLGLGLLCGCTSTVEGTPDPVGVMRSAASPAPPIAHPIDIQRYVSSGDVCPLLPADTAPELGMERSHQSKSNSGFGPTCLTSTSETTYKSIYLGLTPGMSLDMIYNQHRKFGYFVTDQLQGYPIVMADNDDDRPEGECRLELGVNKKSTVTISYDNSSKPGQQSCEMAKGSAARIGDI